MIHGYNYSIHMKEKASGLDYMCRRYVRNLIAGLAMVCFIVACDSASNLSPEQHLEKAHSFIAENNLNAAIIEITNALHTDANLPAGRWLLGSVYLQIGDGATAETEFINARDLGYAGEDLDAALLRAYILQGKFLDVVSDTTARVVTGDLPANFLVLRGDAFLALN